jgi:glutamate--cysteine ligase
VTGHGAEAPEGPWPIGRLCRTSTTMPLSYDDLFAPFQQAMKPRDLWRVGAEAEKFGVRGPNHAALPYEGRGGIVEILEALVARFGWRPVPEVEGGPIIALERDAEHVTLEPGGQLELSGAPLLDVHGLHAETTEHLAELHAICDPLGIVWLGMGFHPFARQEDLPWVPKQRYEVMKKYLPTRGARALDMMRRTATVQANFDYASEEDAMRKLRVALRLTVLVTAIFANSPLYEGRLAHKCSERAAVWLAVDPDRQGLLPRMWQPKSSLLDYVEWALDVPMFLFKRDGRAVLNTGQTFRAFMDAGFQGHRPDIHDWETHLNSLFPEVRLKNTLEVRGGDSLPVRLASSLPALWTGILYDDQALAEAESFSETFTPREMEELRPAVVLHGLAAEFRGKRLVEGAERLLSMAQGGLSRRARLSKDGQDETVHLAALAKLVGEGKCPADELTQGLPSEPRAMAAEVVLRSRV